MFTIQTKMTSREQVSLKYQIKEILNRTKLLQSPYTLRCVYVCMCGCEAVRGQLGFLFTALHLSALPLGRGLLNATENWRNMSAALFDFLSASKTPAGSGNESANRTRKERDATHD